MTEFNPVREGRIWELVQEICSLSHIWEYTISIFIHDMDFVSRVGGFYRS